jgi:FliI/YscN family ATPase
VGPELLGRVINGQGQAIDGGPAPRLDDRVLLQQPAPAALQRPPIDTELSTGIRAIDGLLPCGRGQRLGIFAGAGIGKSVLLGMLARNSAADVNVIALIGERGREVKDFLDKNLGPQGLRKSVVVVATSDEPALAATAVAEYFRDQGREVLLAMDSLTRFALAQREIGLALGEPPAARGYPPSVLASLPRLIERAGRSPRGTITAFYTVLVEGDDLQEPISDAARSLLDGHLVLSRKLAESGHYPAIDVLQSVSRLARELASPEQAAAMARVRQRLAVYREHEDVISIGAYRPGSNPAIDDALRAREPIQRFLRQQIDEPSDTAATRAALQELVNCVAAA